MLIVPAIMVLLSQPLEKAWDDAVFDESYAVFQHHTQLWEIETLCQVASDTMTKLSY